MMIIVPIVEGQGEVEALPKLIYKMSFSYGVTEHIHVNPPIRVKIGSFLNDKAYFAKRVELAAAKSREDVGIVLILLDCDDDCPARLGPDLMNRAREVRGDVRYLVVLAYREFETWFIYSIKSMGGKFGIPIDADRPPRLERIRNAKGWIGAMMTDGYDPIRHQAKMVGLIDMEAARASSSFNRFYERLKHILVECITKRELGG